ncbi:MAG: LytR/AlgR family response regulator transcription factor [Gammaproteobacteria bacterium]
MKRMPATDPVRTESIRTLIVDDEPLARAGLRKFCAQQPDLEVIAECGDGTCAVQTIERERPHLVFLDIEMQEMSGFDVLARLAPDTLPYVVFTTAHDGYALNAYDYEAVDFLLKPFDMSRFNRSLDRVRRRLVVAPETLRTQLAGALRSLTSLGSSSSSPQYLQRVAIRHGQRTSFIDAADIDCIEARRNYVDLHVGPSKHELHTALKEFEEKLDPARFLRIHRSLLVNMERVEEIQNWFNGCYRFRLASGAIFTSGRTYRKDIQNFLNNEVV